MSKVKFRIKNGEREVQDLLIKKGFNRKVSKIVQELTKSYASKEQKDNKAAVLCIAFKLYKHKSSKNRKYMAIKLVSSFELEL